jgi:hypothetical protein
MLGEKRPRSDQQIVLERLFLAQLGLIVTLTLVAVAIEYDLFSFGAFWPTFILGAIGGSVGMLRRIRGGDAAAIGEAAPSWVATLMPLLYGGVMAGVAYLLFISRLLSGEGGDGLFTSNLFPRFTEPPKPFTLKGYFEMGLVEGTDLGKLLIWSFVAGYSEKFVTGILRQLERSQTPKED